MNFQKQQNQDGSEKLITIILLISLLEMEIDMAEIDLQLEAGIFLEEILERDLNLLKEISKEAVRSEVEAFLDNFFLLFCCWKKIKK